MTFSPAALRSHIAQQAQAAQSNTPNAARAAKPHTLTQLLDAREVVRVLAFHLVHGRLKDRTKQKRHAKAALAHIHHGGLYTNIGLKTASGAIEQAQIGGSVKVRSLWLAGRRDAQSNYWRAYQIAGYKPDPFPNFPESLLVLDCLREFVSSCGQELIAGQGLEFIDLAQEILSRGLYEPTSRILALSSSKQALQLVSDRAAQVCKVSLKENAGQRVMGVRDAYGWLTSKLERASLAKQTLFFDMTLPEFLAHPCKFLGRYDYLERVGIRQYKAQAEHDGGIPAELLSVCEGSRSEHYPSNLAIENSLSKIPNYLESGPQISAQQLAMLEKYLISSGQGLPIAKIKLPLRLSVFNA